MGINNGYVVKLCAGSQIRLCNPDTYKEDGIWIWFDVANQFGNGQLGWPPVKVNF